MNDKEKSEINLLQTLGLLNCIKVYPGIYNFYDKILKKN